MNYQMTGKSEFCCIIGRDSRDNEQRELSPKTSRMFSELLHTLNYTGFLLKIRDTFLDIERGNSYYEHTVQPKTFFYCPMLASDERSGARMDAAAVWGECGLYGEGREFRYAHIFFEDYRSLDPHELLCKLFSTKFLNGSEITAILDQDAKNTAKDFGGEYLKNIQPKSDGRFAKLSKSAAEKICAGKTVVIKLSKTSDFNSSAHELLLSIISLLPGELRKQIGFAAYMQEKQIRRFLSQSNNLRLIVVDSDVELSEFEEARSFVILDAENEYSVGEDIEFWSGIDFSERELHSERFEKANRRIASTKLISELVKAYRENGLMDEPEIKSDEDNGMNFDNTTGVAESKIIAENDSAEAEDDNDVNASSDKKGVLSFFGYREVKLIAAISAIIGVLIGFGIGMTL